MGEAAPSSVGNLAETYGAQATVTFQDTTLVTHNDPALLEEILPTLRSVAGPGGGELLHVAFLSWENDQEGWSWSG